MLVIVRHAEDDGSAEYAHDPPLSQRSIDKAARVGSKLVSRYGDPDVVYTSPFRRARESARAMFPGARIIVKPELSRYFTSGQKRHPMMAPSTAENDPYVDESWSQFNRRVLNCYRELKAEAEHHDRKIFVVTHVLFLLRVGKHLGLDMDKRLKYSAYLKVKGDKISLHGKKSS